MAGFSDKPETGHEKGVEQGRIDKEDAHRFKVVVYWRFWGTGFGT